MTMYFDNCGGPDWDTDWFFRRFRQGPPKDIVEIGADDEPIAPILVNRGFKVTGYDLRKKGTMDPTFDFHLEDFVKASIPLQSYDIVISISTIEHFGIAYFQYGGPKDDFYDVKACRKIYDILRPGGRFYVTVPYGKTPLMSGADWRIYDSQAFQERIVGKFTPVLVDYFFSAAYGQYPIGTFIEKDEADQISAGPNLTIGAILERSP